MLHLLWAIPASLAVGVIWLAAAIANFKFGLSQGTNAPDTFLLWTVTSSQVNAYTNLAFDVLKSAGVMIAFIAFQARAWTLTGMGSLIFAGCLLWSSQNAIGYVLSERAAAVDGRGQTADQWSALKAEYDETRKARDMTPDARPASVVRADVARAEADAAFVRTKSCTDATKPESIAFCNRWRGLQAELAAATARAEYDARIEKLRGELDSRKRVTSAEPLMAAAAILLGTGEKTVETGRSVAYAGLVELVAAFGLAAIWGAFMLAWRRKRPADLAAFARPEPVPAPERQQPPVQPRKQEPHPMPQKKPSRRPRGLSSIWKGLSRLWGASPEPEKPFGPPRLVETSPEPSAIDPGPRPRKPRQSQDDKIALQQVESWLGLRFRREPGQVITVLAAHRDFANWATSAGFENPVPLATFVQAMKEYDIAPRDTGKGKVYDGAIVEKAKRRSA